MDEIGLMVRDVVDGFVYIHRISGVDNRVMPAQPVLVHGKRPLPGIVASKPPHLLSAGIALNTRPLTIWWWTWACPLRKWPNWSPLAT